MASLSVWLAHQKSSAKLLQGGRLYPGLSLMLVRAPNAREQMFPVHPAERKPRMVLTSRLQSHWLGHGSLVVSGSIRDKNIFFKNSSMAQGQIEKCALPEWRPAKWGGHPGASTVRGHWGKGQAERKEAMWGARGESYFYFFCFCTDAWEPNSGPWALRDWAMPRTQI